MYWALYAAEADAVSEIEPPALAAAADLKALCDGADPDLVAGNALRAFPAQAARIDRPCDPDARATAAAIVRLAARGFARGEAVPPALAAPLYVRDRVAMTIDERRRAAGAGR
jgi:tRNA threonylcarbamoyladenosine biosynthesis protein TsaB